MGKIIQLDKVLINQISAGEVIERPLGVVKELVENAIDAKSKNIKIEIKDGGKTYISIEDDGEGFELEDLKICLNKHTTSKIKDINDLYNVLTFGFRGEALSSISSISKISIITKIKDSLTAYRLDYDNISGQKITNTTSNNGTKIIVKDLFFNTPARLNYLKTTKTEYSKILSYLQAVSLSYPSVGFEFIADDKKVFKINPDETLYKRVYDIYGNDFVDNILEVNFLSGGISISGYITNPKISFPNKNKQNLFVNHRPISSPLIFKAINDAYNRFIPHSMHPGYILNINLDPTTIDVNVHPRKQEIRFENESNIFRGVYHAILEKLEKSSLIKNDFIDNNLEVNNFGENIDLDNKINHTPNNYYTGSGNKFKSYSPYKDISFNPNQKNILDATNFSKAILDNNYRQDLNNDTQSGDLHYTKLGKIVGQTFNSYIIVEKDGKIILFDQHALAERVIYERLVNNKIKHNIQNLLIPENIKLTHIENIILKDYNEVFLNMGFQFEQLSNDIVNISSIPDFVKKENIKNIVLGIIEDIQSGNDIKSKTLQEVKNKIFAYTACRSAIKFGNKLNLFEINKLLNDAFDGYSSTCPHGRPVIFEISLNELKDKYER